MSDVEEDIQKEHENLQKLVKREEKKRKLMNSPGKDQITFEDIKQTVGIGLSILRRDRALGASDDGK